MTTFPLQTTLALWNLPRADHLTPPVCIDWGDGSAPTTGNLLPSILGATSVTALTVVPQASPGPVSSPSPPASADLVLGLYNGAILHARLTNPGPAGPMAATATTPVGLQMDMERIVPASTAHSAPVAILKAFRYASEYDAAGEPVVLTISRNGEAKLVSLWDGRCLRHNPQVFPVPGGGNPHQLACMVALWSTGHDNWVATLAGCYHAADRPSTFQLVTCTVNGVLQTWTIRLDALLAHSDHSRWHAWADRQRSLTGAAHGPSSSHSSNNGKKPPPRSGSSASQSSTGSSGRPEPNLPAWPANPYRLTGRYSKLGDPIHYLSLRSTATGQSMFVALSRKMAKLFRLDGETLTESIRWTIPQDDNSELRGAEFFNGQAGVVIWNQFGNSLYISLGQNLGRPPTGGGSSGSPSRLTFLQAQEINGGTSPRPHPAINCVLRDSGRSDHLLSWINCPGNPGLRLFDLDQVMVTSQRPPAPVRSLPGPPNLATPSPPPQPQTQPPHNLTIDPTAGGPRRGSAGLRPIASTDSFHDLLATSPYPRRDASPQFQPPLKSLALPTVSTTHSHSSSFDPHIKSSRKSSTSSPLSLFTVPNMSPTISSPGALSSGGVNGGANHALLGPRRLSATHRGVQPGMLGQSRMPGLQVRVVSASANSDRPPPDSPGIASTFRELLKGDPDLPPVPASCATTATARYAASASASFDTTTATAAPTNFQMPKKDATALMRNALSASSSPVLGPQRVAEDWGAGGIPSVIRKQLNASLPGQPSASFQLPPSSSASSALSAEGILAPGSHPSTRDRAAGGVRASPPPVIRLDNDREDPGRDDGTKDPPSSPLISPVDYRSSGQRRAASTRVEPMYSWQARPIAGASTTPMAPQPDWKRAPLSCPSDHLREQAPDPMGFSVIHRQLNGPRPLTLLSDGRLVVGLEGGHAAILGLSDYLQRDSHGHESLLQSNASKDDPTSYPLISPAFNTAAWRVPPVLLLPPDTVSSPLTALTEWEGRVWGSAHLSLTGSSPTSPTPDRTGSCLSASMSSLALSPLNPPLRLMLGGNRNGQLLVWYLPSQPPRAGWKGESLSRT
ncbi:hypothetical protein BJ085DRAFT_29626 [Dimargaris cristalligena]|uniref:Uncharacterized protein n=1 Tax=Dimargaris cristalligena TaxID=215637 RepID=A0A4P9ZZU1_9FUNG|nr:hypothetical protein BJ085DRAFT_29626 [Dimargaris cristalligena]|eukprot:RKP39265.1 hypothetical protein BJ085DRAFT_29626 [Dimargaris cristalligena]